jgi:hypothetical protein
VRLGRADSIRTRDERQQQQQRKGKMNTRKQAFDFAMREIRKNGITAKRNVKGCCRSCIVHPEPKDKPIIWHYGGQGNSFTWENDKPVLTYTPIWYDEGDENVDLIYFNHSRLVADSGEITKAGQCVIETFQKHGFKIVWDGKITSCLELVF